MNTATPLLSLDLQGYGRGGESLADLRDRWLEQDPEVVAGQGDRRHLTGEVRTPPEIERNRVRVDCAADHEGRTRVAPGPEPVRQAAGAGHERLPLHPAATADDPGGRSEVPPSGPPPERVRDATPPVLDHLRRARPRDPRRPAGHHGVEDREQPDVGAARRELDRERVCDEPAEREPGEDELTAVVECEERVGEPGGDRFDRAIGGGA